MKKQLKLLFFVAMLVTLVVMTMVFASAADPVEVQGENAYAVKVGGVTKYTATLADAVAAADPGSEITVLKPVTADATSITGKTLTIAGGDNLITVPAGVAWLTVGENANLTLMGMNVTYTGSGKGDATQIIAVIGANAVLTVSGKNTFYVNANNSTGVTSSTTANLIYVGDADNDSAVVNVIGGAKGENTDDRIVINFVGHGFGLKVDNGFLHVKNVYMNNGTGKVCHSAFVQVTGGEALVENSEFVSDTGDKNVSRCLYATGGKINVIDCVVEASSYAISAKGTNAVINVMGSDTKVRNTNTSTGGGALTFEAAGKINVFAGSFSGNQVMLFNGSTSSVLNVYGGTFTNAGAGNMFYFKKAGTFNIVDAGETTTITVNKENKTFTAQGAVIRREVKGVIFRNENLASVIHLGNGTEIYLEGTCSFDARLTGASLTVGSIKYYCLDGMDDADTGLVNANNSTKLPAIGEEKNTWANTTFYILPPASLDMTTGIIEINSKADLLAKADKAQDTTMTTWGGSYKDFEYIEGAVPGFILKSGTTVTLKDNGDTYENILTLFTVEEGATLIIEGNVFKAAASTSAFTPIICVNGGTLTITGENTQFIAEDWTFNATTDHKGLIHATAGSKITISCGGTHTPIIDNDLERINGVAANFVASKNGYLIALDGDGITVTVNGGVFLRKSGEVIPNNDNHTTFSTGSVFGIWGDLTADSTSSLTINGGYFYSHSMVRIFASAQKTEAEVTTPCKGWTVKISGGTFVTNSTGGTEEYPNGGTSTANNNAFQIQAPGVHTITFTEDCTAKVYANENSLALFSVIPKAGGYQNYGCAIDILGGEFEFANIFFNTPNTLGNVSLKIGKAVLTQKADSTSAIIVMPNTTDFGPSSVTLEGASIYAGSGSNLIRTVGNVDVSITGGIYAAGALIVDVEESQLLNGEGQALESVTKKINSFNVKGGTIILMGDNANWYFYDVEIEEGFDPIIVAKANTLIKEGVTLGEYSPVVNYGTLELKAWMSFAADASGYAPELVPGAGLYLGENGNSVTDEGCGIRFKSTVSADVFMNGINGMSVVAVGHLIAPADYVAAAGAFTIDALETLSNKLSTEDNKVTTYIQVNAFEAETEKFNMLPSEDGTSCSFAVALVNLNSTVRSYAAVPYVCVTDGTDFIYYYGAFNSVDNARSAVQIEALLNQ